MMLVDNFNPSEGDGDKLKEYQHKHFNVILKINNPLNKVQSAKVASIKLSLDICTNFAIHMRHTFHIITP